jgi:hypothetical protein
MESRRVAWRGGRAPIPDRAPGRDRCAARDREAGHRPAAQQRPVQVPRTHRLMVPGPSPPSTPAPTIPTTMRLEPCGSTAPAQGCPRLHIARSRVARACDSPATRLVVAAAQNEARKSDESWLTPESCFGLRPAPLRQASVKAGRGGDNQSVWQRPLAAVPAATGGNPYPSSKRSTVIPLTDSRCPVGSLPKSSPTWVIVAVHPVATSSPSAI